MLTLILLTMLGVPAGGTMETLGVAVDQRLGVAVDQRLGVAVDQRLGVAVGQRLGVPVIQRLLVAAPHGGFDRYTEEMARRIALLAGGGYLLASGYRTPAGPINVNRPTEGVGLSPDQERVTPAATAVWAGWKARLLEQQPDLYVEIHGNSRKESAHHIEVATVGIDATEAVWLRDDFAKRITALTPGMPRLPLALEPLESLHYRAAGSKRNGALGIVPKALHFEFPAAARFDERTRGRYADCLASTLAAYVRRRP